MPIYPGDLKQSKIYSGHYTTHYLEERHNRQSFDCHIAFIVSFNVTNEKNEHHAAYVLTPEEIGWMWVDNII